MIDRDTRRRAAIEHMADHLLRHGLKGASLRPLAAAAGTSDRMLLYYFADKDEMLAATLAAIVHRMRPILEAAVAPDRIPADRLLARIAATVRGAALLPFMRLWLELAAAAGRGEQPYLAAAGQIADGFLHWIASRLAVEPGQAPLPVAARLLTLIEGAALLEAIGRADIATAALSGHPPGEPA